MKKIEPIKAFKSDEVKKDFACMGVKGIAVCFVRTFGTAFLMFALIRKAVGLRVSPEGEVEGLDYSEHDGNAYPDFEVAAHAQKQKKGCWSPGGTNPEKPMSQGTPLEVGLHARSVTFPPLLRVPLRRRGRIKASMNRRKSTGFHRTVCR